MSAFVNATPLVLASSAHATATTPLRISAGSLHAAAVSTRSLLHSYYLPTNVSSLTMELDMEKNMDQNMEPMNDDPPREPEKAKLFVGNLSWETTDGSLKQAFGEYGTVIDSRVVTDRFTGKSRGFGFIEYESASDAEEALVSMNGVEVDGRFIRVDRANRRQPRRREPQY